MAIFPTIADYAFLSDCEVSCLVAPNSAVEWLCLPRPDAPSVFGALLDRSAGFFHFGPANVEVPNQRRYVPGTNVLETTWHTTTGWLIVQDLLVVGPAPTEHRRENYRRVPGDTMAQGTLLRIATCCSGRVDLQVNCIPQFEYGKTPGEWSYDNEGYERVTVRSGDLALELAGSLRLGILGPRSYGRTTLEHGEVAWLALSWGGNGPTTEEEALAQLGDDREVLARLAEPRPVRGPLVASLHRAERARAQGPQLRADRRGHGRGHDLVARDARRRAQLGLPLHLDP